MPSHRTEWSAALESRRKCPSKTGVEVAATASYTARSSIPSSSSGFASTDRARDRAATRCAKASSNRLLRFAQRLRHRRIVEIETCHGHPDPDHLTGTLQNSARDRWPQTMQVIARRPAGTAVVLSRKTGVHPPTPFLACFRCTRRPRPIECATPLWAFQKCRLAGLSTRSSQGPLWPLTRSTRAVELDATSTGQAARALLEPMFQASFHGASSTGPEPSAALWQAGAKGPCVPPTPEQPARTNPTTRVATLTQPHIHLLIVKTGVGTSWTSTPSS